MTGEEKGRKRRRSEQDEGRYIERESMEQNLLLCKGREKNNK
jgi:hypothetical protein